MTYEFISLVPVNRQAAVVASCSRAAEARGVWKKHVESIWRVSTKKDIARISHVMYLWIQNHNERCYDKLSIMNRLSEHFGVRHSLCRLIVNQWGERHLIKLFDVQSQHRKPAKKKTRSSSSSR